MAAIRWATAAATIFLVCAAAQAAGDKDAPRPVPTTQPGKVFCKLVIGSTQGGAAGVGSEPWIVQATTEDGYPITSDCSGWLELSAQPQQIDAQQLIGLSYQGDCKRDAASNLQVIDITGSGRKSLVLLNQVGRRDVRKLDRLSDGRFVFVAVEVVEPSATRPTSPWGEPANNIRMHLKIDPTEWSARAAIQFSAVYENLSTNNVQCPMWAAHAAQPLEITTADGKPVTPKVENKTINQPMFAGTPALAPQRTASAGISGEWADSTLTIVSGSSATIWKWSLPPGQYQVRAATNLQDFFYGPGNRPAGVKGCTSQPVTITVTAPGAAGKPDAK